MRKTCVLHPVYSPSPSDLVTDHRGRGHMSSYWLEFDWLCIYDRNRREWGLLWAWCAILCTYLCMLPEEAAPAPLLRTTVSCLSLSTNTVRTSQTSACSHLGIKHEAGVCAILSLGHTNRSVSRGTKLLLELYICHNLIVISLQSKISLHVFPLSSLWLSYKLP